jgi:hypothetical protein
MRRIRKHLPVKLIIGFNFKDADSLKKTQGYLVKRFGKLDFESKIIPFIHSTYYEKEFGKDLKRKFISFDSLISPNKISDIKIFTNKIEQKLSIGACRIINIDPGYLNLSKLVLATTKDYTHRIYLNKDIYAEVTLYYKDKNFRFWEWTYPDYQTSEYIEVFNKIRNLYEEQTRSIRQS